MKKMSGVLVIAVLLASMAACGKPGKSPVESTPELPSSSQPRSVSEPTQESVSVIPAEYTSLVQLCNTVLKPRQYWQFELPD